MHQIPDRKTLQNQAMSIFFFQPHALFQNPTSQNMSTNPMSENLNVHNDCQAFLRGKKNMGYSLDSFLPFAEPRAIKQTSVVSQDTHFSRKKKHNYKNVSLS